MDSGEDSSSSSKKKLEKLEVPSQALQLARKAISVEKLLNAPKRPIITKVEPSQLLDRVKNFIPQIKDANEKLALMDKKDYVIDEIDDAAETYIEMDIAIFNEEEEDKMSIVNNIKSLEDEVPVKKKLIVELDDEEVLNIKAELEKRNERDEEELIRINTIKRDHDYL